MFLSKHKNGFYYVYYLNEQGKRLSISTHSRLKSEAYDFLTDFKDKLKQRQKEILTPINFYLFVFELSVLQWAYQFLEYNTFTEVNI